MMRSPKLTIGMVVYNEEKHIPVAIQSLLKQTYRDFKLVIANNGSTDATGKIAETFASNDDRITVIHADLNDPQLFYKIVHAADTDYYMGAAGHDYYSPSFIEKCISQLDADPAVVLAYPRAQWMNNDGILGEIPGLFDTRGLQPCVRSLMVAISLVEAYQAYGVYRLPAFKTVTRHKVIGYDHVFLSELAYHGTFALVDEPLFFMRKAEDWGNWEVYRKKHLPDENRWSEGLHANG